MNTITKKRGILAGVGALVSAAALALGGAAAVAAPAIPTTSNIVITKLTTPPGGPGSAANGIQTGQPGGPSVPAGAQPIQNVVFKAYAVPLSNAAGTNAWQQEIAGMTVAAAQTAIGANPSAFDFPATNGSGVTNWNNAPRGLYLIREIGAPNGVTKAADFLVAVPLTDPQNHNNWLSTIHIYPKNSSVHTTKTVNEGSSVAVGQNVSWTVHADIPRDETISKYELVDNLDTRLTYVPTAAVSLTGTGVPTLVACTAVNVPANCDYTLSYAAPQLKVVFSSHGRAALVTAWKADPTSQVKLDLTTTVNATAMNQASTAAASINNTATLYANDADPTTSTPATLKVGDIKITKLDGSTGNPLPANKVAKFSVYLTKVDAENRQNAITVNGQSVFTTTAGTGALTISGLFFSNYVNGQAVANPTNYRGYWINEVEAPAGYELLAAPINIPVTDAGADVANVDVENSPTSGGFVLPLTGGTGTLFLTIGGIAILAIVLLVARRRRSQDAAAE